jgi:hypothetical protein
MQYTLTVRGNEESIIDWERETVEFVKNIGLKKIRNIEENRGIYYSLDTFNDAIFREISSVSHAYTALQFDIRFRITKENEEFRFKIIAGQIKFFPQAQ